MYYILCQIISGCSAVGLAHMIWDHGVGGSSPSTPTIIYRLKKGIFDNNACYICFDFFIFGSVAQSG